MYEGKDCENQVQSDHLKNSKIIFKNAMII